jgi:signal transduction histidine kinase
MPTCYAQTEEALRRALTHEKNLNQIRLSVLTTISHEFRTPLATILSSVDILERYGDKLPEDRKLDHYQTIRGFVGYLNDTIQDATSIEQLNEAQHLVLETFDVIAFTRQLIDDTEQITTKSGMINFHLVAEHEQEVVRWDPSLYRRIVMNLLNNALKYSSGAIRCILECTENTICLQVEDHGDGIAQEDQKHIFEAFYRGKNAEFIPGIGIGLQVVQRAVEAHGGTIRFESQPEQGTTFMVEMPRRVSIE